MSILTGLTPADLGFPAKFSEFREIQAQLVDWAVYGDPDLGTRRFMIAGVAGGSGKSLAAQTIAKMTGRKTVVLTATRGLEDQVVNDGFDLVNVRGKQNYECVTFNPHMPDKRWTCAEGEEIDCDCLGDKHRCPYQMKVEEAKKAQVVLTNYSYWMYARRMNKTALEGEPHGPVSLLILDECQKAFSSLASMLSSWVGKETLQRWVGDEARLAFRFAHGSDHGVVTQAWIDCLSTLSTRLQHHLGGIALSYHSEAQAYRESEEFRKVSKLVDTVNLVVGHATDDNWIWKETKTGVQFDCVWPALYAERYLFSGVEKVVLISATSRPKLAPLLGIRRDEMLFKEWPRVFSSANNPVVHVKTGKIGKNATEEDRNKAIVRLDEILEEWQGHRGMVCTSSYKLAEWIQGKSRFGRWMILNKPGESADAVAERYRKTPPPAFLVSPSYGTGFDFADEACEFVVVFKLPYADRSDPIIQTRCETDPDWYNYQTAQEFSQSCWRGTRHAKDKCTVIVTDDSIGFLMRVGKTHMPRWFNCRTVAEVPRAPENVGRVRRQAAVVTVGKAAVATTAVAAAPAAPAAPADDDDIPF